MKLSFPAMRGRIGNREYYVAMMKMNVVPKLFKFKDWGELPPEQRAQRVVQKSRIPEITQYILDNEDGYLFSSLTASFNCEPEFTTLDAAHPDLGLLEVPLESDFVINDGQHRRAAIEEALSQNPKLGEETISVVLFPWEDLDRMQQMFSDLNRTARTTSKSLNILYNHRDLLSQVALIVAERVEVFKNMVDKDRVSLPLRSPKLFTLGSLYDATAALLNTVIEADMDDKQNLAIDFWEAVGQNMPEWAKVKNGDMKPFELRQEFIHTHAVVLWGIGAMGQTLVSQHPDDWAAKLRGLRSDSTGGLRGIDWRRTNREWQGIAMSCTDVVNRRQSRNDTAAFIKQKLGLPLTETEQRSLRGATAQIDELKRLTRELSAK
jgi:DNA sulfur modification protein DndB